MVYSKEGTGVRSLRPNWATRRQSYIIASTLPTSCMATLMILSKSRPCDSARSRSWPTCTPMAIRISALLAALAILLLPVVSCGGCPPKPSISSISPSSATAGAAGFSLIVNGGNFSSNAVVVWNGSALTTSFVNSNQLSAADLGDASRTAGHGSGLRIQPYGRDPNRWYGVSHGVEHKLVQRRGLQRGIVHG